MFIHDLCQTKDMVYHVVPWCTMLFHVSTSICCFQYLSLNSNYLLPLPWLIMVDHGLWTWLTMVDHGWHSSFSESVWPWLTMVSLVPFNVHGRPWSNHGQTMDKPWFTMVANHEKPCSKHGWPWSNHDPGAGVVFKFLRFEERFEMICISNGLVRTAALLNFSSVEWTRPK